MRSVRLRRRRLTSSSNKHSKKHAQGNHFQGSSAHPNGKAAWIGVDLGDRWSEVCELDAAGVVRERVRVRTTPAAFQEYFAQGYGYYIRDAVTVRRKMGVWKHETR